MSYPQSREGKRGEIFWMSFILMWGKLTHKLSLIGYATGAMCATTSVAKRIWDRHRFDSALWSKRPRHKIVENFKNPYRKKNWPTYPFFQPCYLKQSFFFLPYLLLNDWVDDTQGLHIGFMRAFRRASSRCQAHKPPNLVTTMIAVGGQREATDAWRPCSETTAGKLGPAAGKPLVYCKSVLISRTAI